MSGTGHNNVQHQKRSHAIDVSITRGLSQLMIADDE